MTPARGWFYSFLDPQDQWFAEDKISHFGWAGAVYALGWAHGGPSLGWVFVVAGSLLVEIVELWRWQEWQNIGAPTPWPTLTDKLSPKDIAIALLGALTMAWLLPG